MPISYHGRTYEEGKKIGWKDGLKALGVILRFWLIDDLYAAPYGRGVLNNLTGTPQYLSWLARRCCGRHMGDAVLEVGAGIGNFSGRLMGRRMLYVAAEKDPAAPACPAQSFPAHAQRRGAAHRSRGAARISPAWTSCFDTVLCLNVLEYLDDPDAHARIAARRA